jgi:Leucine-rich repeat (LRR) protein/ferric-dicitrate binding protein FerR (iron transport regulator)
MNAGNRAVWTAEHDRLIDVLLAEVLGSEGPPDVTSSVLARARAQRRYALPILAAAALILVAVLATLWVHASAYPSPKASGAYTVVGGGEVKRGSTLRTADRPASVALGGYCRVEVEPRSSVRIEGAKKSEEVFLEQGAITCEVNRRVGAFAARTEVGNVSATGTKFIVRVLEGSGDMKTRRMFVKVIVGAVLVSGAWGELALAAGEERTVPEAGTAAAQVEASLPAADRVWVDVEGLEAGFGFQKETVLAAPDDWLYIGGNLHWCYDGGRRLFFSQQGSRVFLAMDGGEARLAGVLLRAPPDVAEAQRLLAEARGPLTVWCDWPVVSQLAALPGAGNIASLCVSGEALASDLWALAGIKNLTSLRFGSGAGRVANLEPLANLKSLRSLSLSGLNPAADLSPLGRLPNLRALDLFRSSGVSDLSFLAGLHALTSLNLGYCTGLSNLSPLAGLEDLRYLNLEWCNGLRDVSPLAQLTDLQELNLGGCKIRSGVSALASLSGLRSLTAPETGTEADLRAIANGCKELEFLGLTGPGVMRGLSVAGEFSKLTSLHIDEGGQFIPDPISDLSPIGHLTGLRELVVQNCREVSDLSALTGLKGLASLEVTECPKVSDLSPLSELQALRRLGLGGCDNIQNLSPIQKLSDLQELHLPRWTTNEDLAALLPKLPNLESLSLSSPIVWDLKPLANLTGLQSLDLGFSISVYDLTPLTNLSRLQRLCLYGCESLTDLSPIHAIIRRHGSVAVGQTLKAQLQGLKATPAAATETGPAGTAPRGAASPGHRTKSQDELQRTATVAKGLGDGRLMLEPMDQIAAFERFYDAYRLKEKENVKLIIPPLPERQAYYERFEKDQFAAIPRGPESMVFRWLEPCLQRWGMAFGGTHMSDLLRWIPGLGRQDIEGRDDALQRQLSCDVVYRVGVAPEVMAKEIEQELRTKLNWPVRLSFREVNRTVVAVSGVYRYSPLPGLAEFSADDAPAYDKIEIYGSQQREDPRFGGGGSGNFARFLQWVGDYVGRQLVSDMKGPVGLIEWRDGPLPRGVQRGRLPDDEVALVLQHLGEQTGLTFKEEERQVRILYVDLDLPPGAAW